MHNSPAGDPATVSALPTIIQFYRDRSYTVVHLTGGTGNRLPTSHRLAARRSGASAGS